MNDPRDKIADRRCGECGAPTTCDEYHYPSCNHKRSYACERVRHHDAASGHESDVYRCHRSPAGRKRIRDLLLMDLRDKIRHSDADSQTQAQLLAALADAT